MESTARLAAIGLVVPSEEFDDDNGDLAGGVAYRGGDRWDLCHQPADQLTSLVGSATRA